MEQIRTVTKDFDASILLIPVTSIDTLTTQQGHFSPFSKKEDEKGEVNNQIRKPKEVRDFYFFFNFLAVFSVCV